MILSASGKALRRPKSLCLCWEEEAQEGGEYLRLRAQASASLPLPASGMQRRCIGWGGREEAGGLH